MTCFQLDCIPAINNPLRSKFDMAVLTTRFTFAVGVVCHLPSVAPAKMRTAASALDEVQS